MTFLPFRDYRSCAFVLDQKRLGSCRTESLGILLCLDLTIPDSERTRAYWQFKDSPIVEMWRGHGLALQTYALIMCNEWSRRGYRHGVTAQRLLDLSYSGVFDEEGEWPHWMHDDRVFANHRGILLAKNPAHYGQFGWTEAPTSEYYWP